MKDPKCFNRFMWFPQKMLLFYVPLKWSCLVLFLCILEWGFYNYSNQVGHLNFFFQYFAFGFWVTWTLLLKYPKVFSYWGFCWSGHPFLHWTWIGESLCCFLRNYQFGLYSLKLKGSSDAWAFLSMAFPLCSLPMPFFFLFLSQCFRITCTCLTYRNKACDTLQKPLVS